MEIVRAFLLVYRPGERTSVHRDMIKMNDRYPWHACLMNFQGRPHPTFVYDPKLDKRVDFPGWATAFNFCDYHGGHVREGLTYSVRVDGWFDGVAGFRYKVPVWNGDWHHVKSSRNPVL